MKARKWIQIHESDIPFTILDFCDFTFSSILPYLRFRRSIRSRFEFAHKILDLCIEFTFDIDCTIFSERINSIDTVCCDTLHDLYLMRHPGNREIAVKLCSNISRKGIIDISLHFDASCDLICMCHIFWIDRGFKIENIHKGHRM